MYRLLHTQRPDCRGPRIVAVDSSRFASPNTFSLTALRISVCGHGPRHARGGWNGTWRATIATTASEQGEIIPRLSINRAASSFTGPQAASAHDAALARQELYPGLVLSDRVPPGPATGETFVAADLTKPTSRAA